MPSAKAERLDGGKRDASKRKSSASAEDASLGRRLVRYVDGGMTRGAPTQRDELLAHSHPQPRPRGTPP
jgi:hypothetical protein